MYEGKDCPPPPPPIVEVNDVPSEASLKSEATDASEAPETLDANDLKVDDQPEVDLATLEREEAFSESTDASEAPEALDANDLRVDDQPEVDFATLEQEEALSESTDASEAPEPLDDAPDGEPKEIDGVDKDDLEQEEEERKEHRENLEDLGEMLEEFGSNYVKDSDAPKTREAPDSPGEAPETPEEPDSPVEASETPEEPDSPVEASEAQETQDSPAETLEFSTTEGDAAALDVRLVDLPQIGDVFVGVSADVAKTTISNLTLSVGEGRETSVLREWVSASPKTDPYAMAEQIRHEVVVVSLIEIAAGYVVAKAISVYNNYWKK